MRRGTPDQFIFELENKIAELKGVDVESSAQVIDDGEDIIVAGDELDESAFDENDGWHSDFYDEDIKELIEKAKDIQDEDDLEFAMDALSAVDANLYERISDSRDTGKYSPVELGKMILDGLRHHDADARVTADEELPEDVEALPEEVAEVDEDIEEEFPEEDEVHEKIIVDPEPEDNQDDKAEYLTGLYNSVEKELADLAQSIAWTSDEDNIYMDISFEDGHIFTFTIPKADLAYDIENMGTDIEYICHAVHDVDETVEDEVIDEVDDYEEPYNMEDYYDEEDRPAYL